MNGKLQGSCHGRDGVEKAVCVFEPVMGWFVAQINDECMVIFCIFTSLSVSLYMKSKYVL